jgi:S1-C subfamily serine protease
MESPQKPKSSRWTMVLTGAIIISLLIGGTVGYAVTSLATSNRIGSLEDQVSTLETQVSNLQSAQDSPVQNVTYDNATFNNTTYVFGDNASLSQLYDQVHNSVVVVQGVTVTVAYDFWGRPYYYYSEVQGSGFVYNATGEFVIITNYHVIEGASNITVTFTNGDSYAANVTGSDSYADLAVLLASASQDEYKALAITSSLTLKVGDPVIAVGDPLGYVGSMSSGIVSALGRTVSVSWSSYAIADCIQTTTPINPGNSGGPLLNYQGEVVGMTSYTALTSQDVAAQGLGLAIPSSTILREVESLVINGSYNNHPWLGISGQDMTYAIAQAMNMSETYGVQITQMTTGGPADNATLKASTATAQIEGTPVPIGGDVIIAINNTRIRNMDDLSSYLEEYTTPGQTINVTIIRNVQTQIKPVTLEARPST